MPSFGTLKADTLTHSTAGSITTDNVVEGSAKGRVKISYSSGTPSQDETFNHSSVTDSANAFATLNLTNSMNTINYAVTQTNAGVATDRYGWGITELNPDGTLDANTTSTYKCTWLSYVPNFRDPDRASFVIHGDLA